MANTFFRPPAAEAGALFEIKRVKSSLSAGHKGLIPTRRGLLGIMWQASCRTAMLLAATAWPHTHWCTAIDQRGAQADVSHSPNHAKPAPPARYEALLFTHQRHLVASVLSRHPVSLPSRSKRWLNPTGDRVIKQDHFSFRETSPVTPLWPA